MPPTISSPAVEHLIAFLHPRNVAVYAQTREECASRILQIVMNLANDRWRAAGVGPHPGCTVITETIQAVVRDCDVAELAVQGRVPGQEVGRILSVVEKATRTQWETVAAQPVLRYGQVVPRLGLLEWPGDVRGHAQMLREAFDRVCHGRGPLVGPDAVVIPAQDLGMLRNGMKLLERKLVQANAAPVYSRPEWYDTGVSAIAQTTGGNVAVENNVETVPAARMVELGRPGQGAVGLTVCAHRKSGLLISIGYTNTDTATPPPEAQYASFARHESDQEEAQGCTCSL